jgi:hypothetical protein
MTTKASYYGAYLGGNAGDSNRQWWVMYRVGGYMYDRLFKDCPFSVKREIVMKGGLKK